MFGKRAANVILWRIALPAAVALCLVIPQAILALDSPVPLEINDLSLGANMASLMEKINGAGSSTAESPQEKRRPKVTWSPSGNVPYQNIEFSFTEKDRLFVIRYNFKEMPRSEFQRLKKAFFNRYKLLWDDPMRLKVRYSDVLVYQPEKGQTFLLEFTNRDSGLKSIELFERRISAQDRFQKPPEAAPQESGDNALQQPDKKESDQK